MPDDIETIELLLYTYAESGQYAELEKASESYIDLYPTQASLYYYAGYGANRLSNIKKQRTGWKVVLILLWKTLNWKRV